MVNSDVMEDLYNYINPLNQRHSPMISKDTLDIVLDNKDASVVVVFTSQSLSFMLYDSKLLPPFSLFPQRLNSAIISDRDFSYNFFGFKVCFYYDR